MYATGIPIANYGLSMYAGPTVDSTEFAMIKTNHCRVDISADDAYIASLIVAARQHTENILGRRLGTQTWDLTLDYFPSDSNPMTLPYGPWQSITSIVYLDTAGNSQTLGASVYALDTKSFQSRLYPKYGQFFPVTQGIPNAITIRHINGLATVPENIKHAMRLLVDHWYSNSRAATDAMKFAETPLAYNALLATERASWV